MAEAESRADSSSSDEEISNEDIINHWIQFNNLLKIKDFESVIDGQQFEDVEEINGALDDDTSFLLNLRIHNSYSIEKAIQVRPPPNGSFFLQLGVLVHQKIDIDALARLLELHGERANLVILFLRFSTEVDIDDQVDTFESVLSTLEVINNKKIAISSRYDGEELSSSELERMQIECLRRVYDEGFDVVSIDFEFDSTTHNIQDQWEAFTGVVAGTETGSLCLRKQERGIIVNTDKYSDFLLTLKEIMPLLFISEHIGLNFTSSMVTTCRLAISTNNMGNDYISPKFGELFLNLKFSFLSGYLNRLPVKETLETIYLIRLNDQGRPIDFTNIEMDFIFRSLRKVLPSYYKVTTVHISGTPLQQLQEAGKQIHDTYLQPRIEAANAN